MKPYEPRDARPLPSEAYRGWIVKRYAIARQDHRFDESRFMNGKSLAAGALPAEARTPARIGAAFAILHQGEGADYYVLGWWDRENELPLRVFVCAADEPTGWRAAREGESICVWDLEIIKFERDAYVDTVLRRAGDSLADYVARSRPAGPV